MSTAPVCELDSAPDLIEPFEAWRVWNVVRRDGRYSLASILRQTLWPVGEGLAAECIRLPPFVLRLRRRPLHDAPAATCECGIYAADLERIAPYVTEVSYRRSGRVLGRVALWGTVIECERGLRASRAYPARIYVPADAGDPWGADWEEVAFGLSRYRVPIVPLDVPTALATERLTERIAA